MIEFTHHVASASPAALSTPVTGPPDLHGRDQRAQVRLSADRRRTGARLRVGPGGSARLRLVAAHVTAGVLADGDVAVSESEGMFLALLSWDPAPWTYWLTDGGAGTDADPAQTPGRVCDPFPEPARACAQGRLATRTDVDTVQLRTQHVTTPPFPRGSPWPPTNGLSGTTR